VGHLGAGRGRAPTSDAARRATGSAGRRRSRAASAPLTTSTPGLGDGPGLADARWSGRRAARRRPRPPWPRPRAAVRRPRCARARCRRGPGVGAIEEEDARPHLDRAIVAAGEILVEAGGEQLIDAGGLIVRRGRRRERWASGEARRRT
jgi:hypothetical protein